MDDLQAQLNPSERKELAGLNRPIDIQSFLNNIPYSEDEFYRCPLRVLREKKAHCFDGGLFAAMAMRHIGSTRPLILELIPNDRDDDHILALFKQFGHWGAVAQSNFSGLRYREPVYRSLRELVMSYFEDFFNAVGEKTTDRLPWTDQPESLRPVGLDDQRCWPGNPVQRHGPLSRPTRHQRRNGCSSIARGRTQPESRNDGHQPSRIIQG